MEHTDPSLHLPRIAYRHLVRTLRAALPPATGRPDATACRDQAAIAEIAALCPASPIEATLASQVVATNAQAMHALGQQHGPNPPSDAGAQAARMLRLSHDALRLLLRVQAERRKREAEETTAGQAAWSEHCATQWMTEALTNEAEPAAAATPPKDHNPEHDPTERDHETPVSLPESQATEHDPIQQHHVTRVSAPESQLAQRNPTPHHHETAMRRPGPPPARHVVQDQNPQRDPAKRYYETTTTHAETKSYQPATHRPADRITETQPTRPAHPTPPVPA
jgi:hypothetical protein